MDASGTLSTRMAATPSGTSSATGSAGSCPESTKLQTFRLGFLSGYNIYTVTRFKMSKNIIFKLL